MSKCVGICNFNLIEENSAAHQRESSEKAAYPAANVYDLRRRFRVWRTDGFFRVIDGENAIVFSEQPGVDLTADVEPGEYGTISLFLAAVKAALEAAGAATYTVDLATSGKIRIASDLGGGAAIFTLRTTQFSEMAEMMGFGTDTDFSGAATYTADVLRIHSEEWLEWDLAFPVNPQAFILAGFRNQALKLTPNAIVTLQANWTRDWSTPALELAIPYDEFVLATWNWDGLSPLEQGYRYWRVKIVDPENTRRFNEFGLVYLGPVYVTERGCAVLPFDFGPQDLSVVNYAEAGQGFSQKLPITSGVELRWDALTKQEEAELRYFFEIVGRTQPFFIIIDSATQPDGTGAFSTNQRDWVKLVRFGTEPRHNLASPNYFRATWPLREEL